MDLKQKIGQMLMIGFKGTELKPDDAIVHAILNQHIGGVVLFDYDFQTKTYDHNIKNPTQLHRLTQQLQDYAHTPLLISVDYEGGKVNRLKEQYGFPVTLTAEEIGQGSMTQAEQQAELMARTLKNAGINLNLAPSVDLNSNPDNPIIGKLGRSYSADPQQVITCAKAFIKAHEKYGVLCAIKHFPGHGSSTGDTHLGFVDITETWNSDELIPYQQLFSASHCPIVMTSHVVHYNLDKDGYPASISYAITTDLLRKKLGFNGIVMTDDLQMKAIADNYGLREAIRLAIHAGADILVLGNQLAAAQDPAEIIAIIHEDIPASRIDESYARIMQLKQQILEHPHVKA
jgi:beta-N-acetylhexosaminidase